MGRSSESGSQWRVSLGIAVALWAFAAIPTDQARANHNEVRTTFTPGIRFGIGADGFVIGIDVGIGRINHDVKYVGAAAGVDLSFGGPKKRLRVFVEGVGAFWIGAAVGPAITIDGKGVDYGLQLEPFLAFPLADPCDPPPTNVLYGYMRFMVPRQRPFQHDYGFLFKRAYSDDDELGCLE